MIHRYDYNQLDLVHLNGAISVPSSMHSYSLGVEFMRDWFLDRMPEDFFKTVYINGKNVMDDFRKFNREKILTVQKPALSIVPTINTEYNRDTVDLKLGGRDVLVRRSNYYKDAFLKDDDNNVFLGIELKEIEMPFTYRIRVDTRAQQLDLTEYMKMAYRIGATQKHFLSVDFHIPMNIILALAENRGFTIKDGKVEDIVGFLKYLNSHSFAPITYKFRTVNGNSEYFIRMDNVLVFISCLEPLSLDDGNTTGHISKDFHIEMNVTMRMVVPAYYYFYSKLKLAERTYEKMITSLESLYTYKSIEPPSKNEKGWDEYLSTEWTETSRHIGNIPFKELFEGGPLIKVIEHVKDLGISPSVFLDCKIYCENKELEFKINWEDMQLEINKDVKDDSCKISFYIDKEYYNEQLAVIDNIKSSRIH